MLTGFLNSFLIVVSLLNDHPFFFSIILIKAFYSYSSVGSSYIFRIHIFIIGSMNKAFRKVVSIEMRAITSRAVKPNPFV